YLSAPLNTSYGLYRYSGFKEGLAQNRLNFDENMVVANIQEQSDTVAALDRLMANFSGDTFPTAIVTANDHLALQVIQELRNRGLSVGSDRERGNVAVTGFDDLPFASYIQPGLTTVRQPIATISDILLDLLVDMIKSESDSKRKSLAESGHMQDGAEKSTQQKKAVEARKRTNADPHIRWIGPMQALVEPELIVRASA
ncbi:MAG: substrate-binding domain-containing protein, partial [Chloroflexia bacterium]